MLTTTSNWLIEVRCRMGSPPSGLWSQHVVRAQHHPAAHDDPAMSTRSSDPPTEEVTTTTPHRRPWGSSRHQPPWPSPTPPLGSPTESLTTYPPTTYPPTTYSPTTKSPTTKEPLGMTCARNVILVAVRGGPVCFRRFIFVHSVLTSRDVTDAFNCVIRCLLQTRESLLQ